MSSFTVTFFESAAAQTKREETHTLDSLYALLQQPPIADRKDRLPWLKLARFGDARTATGSYRNNANVLEITGVELDYDEGALTPEDAGNALQAAGIEALVYTSPSHTAARPKFRVLAPLSQPAPPAHRTEYAKALARAIGVQPDPASYTLSQSYYYGTTTAGATEYKVLRVSGGPLNRRLADVEEYLGSAFDERSVIERVRADLEEAQPGNRHNATRRAVARLVGSGATDEEIYEIVGPYRTGGAENEGLRKLVESARRKFGQPDPEAVRQVFGGPEEPEDEGDALPPLVPPPKMDEIPPRRFVLGSRALRGCVTAIVGAPGAGKTQLAVQSALAVATGHSGLVADTIYEGGPALLFSNEEPGEEIWRRLVGSCLRFGLHYPPEDLYVMSGYESGLRLMKQSRFGELVANRRAINALESMIREKRIVYVSLDPMVSLATIDENDNAAMESLMTVLREIAGVTDCAIEVLQHTSKGAGRALDPEDLYAGRGASAVAGAVRGSTNMSRMTKKQGEDLGLQDEELRRMMVWTSGAKGNYAPLSGLVWYSREEQQIPNGDRVPVLVHRPDFEDQLRTRLEDAKAEAARVKATTEVSIEQHLAPYVEMVRRGELSITAAARQGCNGVPISESTARRRIEAAVGLTGGL